MKSDACGPKEDSKRCQCQGWAGSSPSQMQDLFLYSEVGQGNSPAFSDRDLLPPERRGFVIEIEDTEGVKNI